MTSRLAARTRTAALALCFLLARAAPAEPEWIPIGPEGGDVRSLAVDPQNPKRVYLGTTGGVLYRSETSGKSWRRLPVAAALRNESLDEIVVFPDGRVLVGFWDVNGRSGGIAYSEDQGETFSLSLKGESVRALNRSQRYPNVVVAGALSGVFISYDFGSRWKRISPEGHREIRNVESVAVDPEDPGVIYAGTWHLAWKTVDGGATWTPIRAGMIEDSDVFTMTIDRRDASQIHATACSGIYSSKNGAALWSRVRGIPFGSRRTRAFAQDPNHVETFYAGTTEGLWVSSDDSLTWRASTALDVVVNAIATLPDGAVLAGTDGQGVLRSIDRGRTWSPSNAGFSERFISRIAVDETSDRVLVGVWGDRRHGGVFASTDARDSWTRLATGLVGREIVSLAARSSTVLAGTDSGLFRLNPKGDAWDISPLPIEPTTSQPRANDVVLGGNGVAIAATALGLFRSEDAGVSWLKVPDVVGEATAVALGDQGDLSIAANGQILYMSRDSGETWARFAEISSPARVNAVRVLPGLVLVATSRGLVGSFDEGLNWWAGRPTLPDADFTSIAAAPDGGTIVVGDFAVGGIYRSDDRGSTWARVSDRGLPTDRVWALAFDRRKPHELFAAAPFGGLNLLPDGGKTP